MSENVDDFGPPQSVPTPDFGPPQPVHDFGPPKPVAAAPDVVPAAVVAPVEAAPPNENESDPTSGAPLTLAAFHAQRGVPQETVAKATEYADALGIAPESLIDDPKSFKAAKDEIDFRESIKHLSQAPKLAALLAHNTALAAASREDLPQLSAIEAGVMDVAHGYYARKARGGGDQDADQTLNDLDRVLAKYNKEEHGLAAEAVRMLPVVGGYGAAGVAAALAAGPAAATGAAVAGTYFVMYQHQSGELYRRIEDIERAHVERDPTYTPLTPKQTERFAKDGAIAGATIFTALGNTFTRALPFVNGALQRLGVNIVAEAGSDTAFKFGVRKLQEAGAHTLSGSFAMSGQAVADDLTVQKATTGTIDPLKATAAGTDAFKHAFWPTLLLAGIEPGRAYVRDVGRIRNAPIEVGQLDRLADMVRSSKLATRAPEMMKDVINAMKDGSDVDTVLVNHEALKDPTVAQAIADVVGEHRVSEAQATQGDVSMTVEDYLVHIATEHHDAIREHVKMSEDGFTLRQATEATDELRHILAPEPAKGELTRLMAERGYTLQTEPDTPARTAKLEKIAADMRNVAIRTPLPEQSAGGRGVPQETLEALMQKYGGEFSKWADALTPEIVDQSRKVIDPRPVERPAPPESAFADMAREATEGKRLGDLQPGRHRRSSEGAATKALRARAQAADVLGTAEQKAQVGIQAGLEGIQAGQRGIREYKYIREAEWAKDLRASVETGDLSEINKTINDLIKRAENHPVEALGQGQVDVLKNIKRTVNAGRKWLEGLRAGTELSPETAAGGLYDVGGTQTTGEPPQPGTSEFIAAQEHNIKFGEREMRLASSEAERARLKAESASVQATRGTVRAGDLLAQAQEHETARDYGRALERAETAALEEADKTRAFLRRYTTDEGRAELGKASVEHRDAVDMLLSGFELGQGVSRPEVARRQGTMQWMAGEEAAGRTPVIPESVLNKLDKFVHWKDLTPQEMRDLGDSVRSIARQAELKNTIVADRGRVEFAKAKGEFIDGATANMKEIPIFQSGDVVPFKERWAAWGRSTQGVILKAEEIVRRLDGGNINGPVSKYYWHPLSESYNRFEMLKDKWSKPIKDAIEAVPEDTRRKWRTETFTIAGRERTMEQAIAVAANQGNASNAFKLLEGLKRGKALGLSDWTQGTVDEFRSHVNRDGWNFVQSIWDSLDSHWEAIAKHEESMTGLVPEKIAHQGFDLWFDKDGNTVQAEADGAEKVHFRGGYYPVIYERQFNFLSRSGRGEGELLSRNYRTATTPQGRLQSRIENYARPIDLTLNGLPNVVREFAKDVAMRESLISVHRLITDPDISNTLNRTIGEPNRRVLEGVVLDAANDMVLPANGAEAFLQVANRLRGGVSASVFSWNVAQTTQNLAGVTQILKHVPMTYVREGLRALTLDPSGAMDFARAASGEMATRGSHINAEMAEAKRSIESNKVIVSHLESAFAPAKQVAQLGLEVFQATDSLVAHLAFRSAYEHAIAPAEKGGLGLDHTAAVRQAERTLRLSIASGRVIDLPAFLRHPVTKLLAPFSGWSATQLNDYMATKYDAQQLAADGDMGKAVRKWAAAHVWVAAGGIAGSLLVFKGPKDVKKDGLDVGDVARWLGIEGALAHVWFTPFLGGSLKKLAEGEDLRSSLLTPTIGRPVETAIKAAIQIRTKAEKKGLETEDYEKFGLGMLEAVATMEGLPVVQAKNTVGYLLDDKSPKDNLLQIGLGVAAGKSRPGKLLDLAK